MAENVVVLKPVELGRIARVFVCSPLAAADERSLCYHIDLAEELCLAAVEAGVAPFAPHVFYTQFLNDQNPDHRKLGMFCGLQWLRASDAIWVFDRFGDSPGMIVEMIEARRYGIPIFRMPPSFLKVQMAIMDYDGPLPMQNAQKPLNRFRGVLGPADYPDYY